MKKSDYTIENVYQGGYSSLKSPFEYSSAGSLGLTTDPRTANILKEVSENLSTGVKQIEVEFVSPQVFDSIPKQHLKEVNRLSKLTGIDVSVHGPVIDTVGITQQGFDELNREASEKTIIEAIKRSHELNPNGNIPIVFHSAEGIPGSEWKTLGKDREAKKLIAINRESGQMVPLKEEIKYYPGTKDLKKGEKYTAERELKAINDTEWLNNLTSIENFRKQADEVMQGAMAPLAPLLTEFKKNEKIELTPRQQAAMQQLQKAEIFLSNAESSLNAVYNKVYKYAPDDAVKEKLKKISEKWAEESEKMKKNLNALNYPIFKSQLLNKTMQEIKEINSPPSLYVPIEKFAVEQASKTFGNAAFKAYDEFGNKAPIINIENPPAGFALSTGEDLKNLVEKSREHFVEKAVKEGMSKSFAKQQAEKLIGATWDVGHINMLKKQGFKDKDIIKETEIIAPFVKHVHLSDNFGFEHTELPMGMGNVPIKEIMKKLGKRGFEAPKIIEAISWWQHFKSPPVKESMEAMGSSIYAEGDGPYWSQSLGLQQNYPTGYGNMLPQTNYEMFGAGFSQLPTELGGTRQGAGGSRMSGRPME